MTVVASAAAYDSNERIRTMARDSNENTETLVPISQIAARLGYLDATVTNRLKASDVVADWDGTPCVSWSTAKATLEQLAAEKATYEREQAAAMAKQMDDEQEGRMAFVRAFENAGNHNRIPGGLVVSLPGEGPTPAWVGEDE